MKELVSLKQASTPTRSTITAILALLGGLAVASCQGGTPPGSDA
jgi:hypothetical protein